MKGTTMILKVVFSLLLWAACWDQGVLGCREGWYDATTVDTGHLSNRKSFESLKEKKRNVLETFERLRLVFGLKIEEKN
jgi:hypothetical protein